MPIDTSLLNRPTGIDFSKFFEPVQQGMAIRQGRLQNKLLELKLQESSEAQDFFKSLLSQGQASQGKQPAGTEGTVGPGGPPQENILGGMGQPVAPGQIDWVQLARDPRVQSNPILAERVQNMMNVQINAQNAAMNQAKTQMEAQTFIREAKQRIALDKELTDAGRSPADTAAILRLYDSKSPDALALATAAVEQPERTLSELRKGLRESKLGGVTEQTIQDIRARNPKLTREQAHIQYQKFQGRARAEGTREAEIDLTKRELGTKGLRVWAAQSLFLGKEPSSRNTTLASMVKDEEAKIIDEIGKRRGVKLSEMDKYTIRGQAQSLYGSLQFQQKWHDVTFNMSSTLDGMLPEVMKAYNAMPIKAQAMPARQLEQYAEQNLKGSEPVGRFVVLATEMAREYNRILLSGPMGGGGTPGSVEERKVTEDWMAGSMPAKTFLGSMNGMKKGSKIRMQAHEAAKNQIMKQMDAITGGHGSELVATPQKPSTILPYLTPDQAEQLPLEDLERLLAEQAEAGQTP